MCPNAVLLTAVDHMFTVGRERAQNSFERFSANAAITRVRWETLSRRQFVLVNDTAEAIAAQKHEITERQYRRNRRRGSGGRAGAFDVAGDGCSA